jgi:hypothetical protein
MNTLDAGDMAPTEVMTRSYVSACTDLRTALTNWAAINARDLAAFNAVLAKNNQTPLAAASGPLPTLVCVSADRR